MTFGEYTSFHLKFSFPTLRWLFLLYASLLFTQPADAQERSAHSYQMKQFTLQQGLPDNFVNALLQDRQGFIWIGTDDGLSRFDGIRFKTFRHQPGDPFSISNNKINALLEDRQGYIWVATNGGLNRYDPATESFRHFQHDPDDEHSLSHDHTRAIFEDESGVIWVGTYNGLNRFEPQGNRFTAYLHQDPFSPSPPGFTKSIQEVSVIGETGDGHLLVGYWGIGVMQFDKKTKRFRPVLVNGSSVARQNLVVERITRTAKGEIWVCAGGWLFLYDANQGLKRFPDISIRSLAIFTPTPSGAYIAGGDGFLVLNEDFQVIQHFVPEASPVDRNQNLVLAAIEDRAGDIWFGTMGGGLFHLAAERKFFLNYRQSKDEVNGLPDNFINALAEVEEDLVWVGSRRQGISVFDRKNNSFSPLPNFIDYPNGLKTKEISVLYPDRDKNIWIGTWGEGLSLYRPSERSFQYFQLDDRDTSSLSENFITDILETTEGEIWVGTTLGLSVLFNTDDVKEGRFKRYRYNPEIPGSLNHQRVTCIRQTKSGQIWVGTPDGLHLYNRQKETFTLYRQTPDKPDALSSNAIRCIFEDCKGRLWIGTAGGLNLLDATQGAFRHFSGMDDLSDGNIAGIQEDAKGFLWVATKKGIARLDPDGMTFKYYDNRDGLDNHSFNTEAFFLSPHSGMIYAGGKNGLSVFEPSRIRDNPFAPPVWITGLKKYASRKGSIHETIVKGMTRLEKLELSYQENIVTFELTSLNFRNPEKNQFAYRLVGFNDNWINIGTKREITMTNLDAGSYTLQVKASNNDGVWNETPTELIIVVHPPWWKTWWAYGLYGLALITIIYLLRHYELNRQRLAFHLVAEKSEATRLKELDTFKSRLYTNLTHEFRTPLTVILGMIGQVTNDPGKYLKEGARLIETNGQNLLRLINQLLDLSKLENRSFQLNLQQGNIVPYLRYVTESFQSFADGRNLSLRFFTTFEQLDMDYDPEQIKQVMTNLISNAVKFTPSGGEVEVRLSLRSADIGRVGSGVLVITVADTGIGISEKERLHIFDRFYQVDGSHTREGEGTGIGLAHSLELVKLMGGGISVESVLGTGTSFQVVVPITQNAARVTGPSELWVPQASVARIDSSQVNPVRRRAATNPNLPSLLIIEDNPDVVVYLKLCLEGLYQLDVAYNGKIGIEKALKRIPDLIVSDVMMPEKDGYEVCDALKNDERTSHIPIILLTAKADTASRISGLKRGADAYLIKPFDKEELLVRLEKLVERQRRLRAYFSQKIHSNGVAALPEAALQEAIEVEDVFIQKVRQIVAENFSDENFALPQLCEQIGMSRSQLFRKMKVLIDESPSDFIRTYRLNTAKTLLETTDLNVSEVAWKVGYKDLAHFSKSFQEAFGVLPSKTSNS